MKISVKNLSLNIKQEKILKDINLSLPQGKLIMLLGNNGAGKTLLIKTIMGFKLPTTGEICYDGKNIKNIGYRERAKFISYIPQNDEKDIRYRVEDFIAMGFMPELPFYAGPSVKMKKQIPEVLEQLGILHLKNKYTDEISGGEYRLASLARTLIQNTPWMLLDEPTSSVDFAKKHQFLTLIKETSKKENKGILMSIHNPSMACDYADIIILMKNGQILDIIDMITTENDTSPRLEKTLKILYGENVAFEKTTHGKVLIWKENNDGFH